MDEEREKDRLRTDPCQRDQLTLASIKRCLRANTANTTPLPGRSYGCPQASCFVQLRLLYLCASLSFCSLALSSRSLPLISVSTSFIFHLASSLCGCHLRAHLTPFILFIQLAQGKDGSLLSSERRKPKYRWRDMQELGTKLGKDSPELDMTLIRRFWR